MELRSARRLCLGCLRRWQDFSPWRLRRFLREHACITRSPILAGIPPYYSFNSAEDFLNGSADTVIYGHNLYVRLKLVVPAPVPLQRISGPRRTPDRESVLRPPAILAGGLGFNPDSAILTGMVLARGFVIRTSITTSEHSAGDFPEDGFGSRLRRHDQPQAVPSAGHQPAGGSLLPLGVSVTDNLGRTLTGLDGRPNQNFATLRN